MRLLLVASGGETATYYAAGKGHTNALHVLIEAKGDVNKARDTGRTPLLYYI